MSYIELTSESFAELVAAAEERDALVLLIQQWADLKLEATRVQPTTADAAIANYRYQQAEYNLLILVLPGGKYAEYGLARASGGRPGSPPHDTHRRAPKLPADRP